MLIGSLLRPLLPVGVRLALVALLAVVVLGNETRLFQVPLPQNGRQVPSTVIADGGRIGAWQFGYEMGTGLRTYMTSGLPHLAALTVGLLASWPYALLAGAAFGAGRGIMPLARIGWDDAADWDYRFRRMGRPFRILAMITMLLAVGGVALGAGS